MPTTTVRAGADEGLLADLDSREEHRTAAHACAAADRRAAPEDVALLGPAHQVVVRRDDAGRDEDVLLEDRVGGDVGIRLDLRPGAHGGVVLDERAHAHDHLVAELAALADARVISDDDPASQLGSGEDDGAREDRGAVSDDERRQRLGARGGTRPEGRRLAHDGVVADHDAFAELGARVDDGGLGDPRGQTRSRSSEAWSCSRLRTTASPVLAGASRSPSPRASARKCEHSRRSGSALSTRGLCTSPTRVLHSP